MSEKILNPVITETVGLVERVTLRNKNKGYKTLLKRDERAWIPETNINKIVEAYNDYKLSDEWD